jgi:hypothetical protein
MKARKILLAIGTALLFGASGALAQTTSGGSTSGSSTTTSGTSSSSGSTGSTGSTTSTGTTGSTSSTGSTTSSDSTHGKSGEPHGNANPHTPPANASAVATAVQAILQKFDANRDQFIAERKTLLDQLAAAKTDADRQAILTQLRSELQTEKDQRTQLGKEIRQELQTLRQQKKGGGG